MSKKTYTGPECAALIKNALNESVANGTSPEIKLLKLVAELEGKAEELVGDGADTVTSGSGGSVSNETVTLKVGDDGHIERADADEKPAKKK